MQHEIKASRLVKRTRYDVLFDGVEYWLSKTNPKGQVKFIAGFKRLDLAMDSFLCVGNSGEG